MEHNCLIIKDRPTDYVMGGVDPIVFKSNLPSGNWDEYIEYYEPQKYSFDTDGCVIFSAQESFDAQINRMIQNNELSEETLTFFNREGYMDTNSLDGSAHFHTSERFLQILTGNGFNGNSLPDPWDVLRKFGALPWTDLPFDATLSQSDFINKNVITQTMYDKALRFLIAIGGKNSIQYHYVNNGTTNIPNMIKALQQSPLCIGVNVGDNWNTSTPTIPTLTETNPGHSVMTYKIITNNNWVFDHYLPNPKELVSGYPINYVLQGIVTITPPPAAPVAPVATPATPTSPAVQPTTQQYLTWLQSLSNWLNGILNSLQGFKGRMASNTMNYSLLKSRTFWVIVIAFLYNGYVAISGQVPANYTVIIDAVFGILQTFFHYQGVDKAATTSATLGQKASGQ
jgi:hypothetical protein